MRKAVQNQILNHISQQKRGILIFPTDFSHLGSIQAVNMALSRLTENKTLVRLAHGIYLYPRMDEELGILYPSTDEIIKAIAKRDRIRLMPTGSYALNRLGLSTQVPMRIVYLTNGKPKKLKVGNYSIQFKPSTPKKLSMKGKLSTLVIQALQELGEKNITDKIIEKITLILQQEDINLVQHDAYLAPAWIKRLLLSLTPNNKAYAPMAKAVE